jgi:hypothetical protein
VSQLDPGITKDNIGSLKKQTERKVRIISYEKFCCLFSSLNVTVHFIKLVGYVAKK